MQVLKIILMVIIILLLLQFIIYVNELISSIGNYFKTKSRYIEIDVTMNRTDFTKQLITLILEIISLEVANLIQSYVTIKKDYDFLKFDSDIDIISKTVFESIRPEIYAIDDSILTEEYLMKYIVQNTKVILLDSIGKMNMVNNYEIE